MKIMEVLKAIKSIVEEKREKKIHPTYAPVVFVKELSGVSLEEFQRQARKLADEGVIKPIKTINGYSIELLKD